MEPALDSPAEVLACVEGLLVVRRRVAVDELDLALAWADLHGGDPVVSVEGGDKLVGFGGDGTPLVRELCVAELAIARQSTVHATRSLMADALDLRHRLPLTWQVVRSLAMEAWVARKVASMSRGLSADAVWVVDVAVAAAALESPGRLLRIAEAKVIEADTARHAAEIESARGTKGVWVGSSCDEAPGIRTVYARVEPSDAVWVDATVDRVADLLAGDAALRARHHPELSERPGRDELRAAAFGWLARPHDLALLLSEIEAAGPDPLPHRASLVVHLHEAALSGQQAVARADAVGPMLVEHLSRLVGHAHIDLRPVIDLNDVSNVNAYEHPERVKLRTRLRVIGDAFPHSASMGERVDHDHVTPFDPGGPPGQTSDLIDAPLTRTHHRAKTHLGYHVEQVGLGRYLWRTPHGLHRLVDASGTHVLTADEAEFTRFVYQRAA